MEQFRIIVGFHFHMCSKRKFATANDENHLKSTIAGICIASFVNKVEILQAH